MEQTESLELKQKLNKFVVFDFLYPNDVDEQTESLDAKQKIFSWRHSDRQVKMSHSLILLFFLVVAGVSSVGDRS